MNMKFTGSIEDLKKKLESLGGNWNEEQANKIVFRNNLGVLNWFPSTGTLQFQGKTPGIDNLQKLVLHFLYPNEYDKPSNASTQISEKTKKETAKDKTEDLYLQGKIQDTELVIGIVNAIGTESNRIMDTLKNRLKGFDYDIFEIRVSDLLPAPERTPKEYDRIKHYMKEGDCLRNKTGNNAILSAGVAKKINNLRKNGSTKIAYIVNSLKHPDEVEFLRKIYGSGFYLLGIHADEIKRHAYLVNDKLLTQAEASELIRVDEDEKIEHGQRTRDTFHLSDFFIALGKNNDYVKNTIQRFLELIFSHPFRNPTFDEFAMFMAFSASIRSGDLSRQVGAVISIDHQIIATGANEAPKFKGGQYWAEPHPETGEIIDIEDGKDYTRGEDSNKAAQKKIISEISQSLISEGLVTEENKQKLEDALEESKISDLTEFGRIVHAEMEAILSCTRVGIPTRDASLYCTTFPCHNCAKHIVDVGITRVVYVEPYPKSQALDLHSDSIYLKTDLDKSSDISQVTFEPFTGVGPRRFIDLFSMSLGNGKKLKRKDKQGRIVEWSKKNAIVRTPLLSKSYLEVEKAASDLWEKATKPS